MIYIYLLKKKYLMTYFSNTNSTFPKFSKETIKKLFSSQQNFFLSGGGVKKYKLSFIFSQGRSIKSAKLEGSGETPFCSWEAEPDTVYIFQRR